MPLNVIGLSSSGESTPVNRATEYAPGNPEAELRARHLDLADAGLRLYRELEARIAALEAELANEPTQLIGTFSQSRRVWTTKELAGDLGVHINTVRGWVNLPCDHRMHISCLRLDQQIRYLPEHVAGWLLRNESRLPSDKSSEVAA